jgi:hypothetical protein
VAFGRSQNSRGRGLVTAEHPREPLGSDTMNGRRTNSEPLKVSPI